MQGKPIYVLIGILGFVAGITGAQPLQQDPGPDGIVSVEAENFDNNVPVDPHTWELITESADGFAPADGFSGGFAMQSTPTTLAGGAGVNEGYAENSPHLDYLIEFTHTGTHYVWVLAYGMDGNSDSLHSGLDGEEIATADRIGGINLNYHWTNTAYQDPERIMFDVPTTGLHTLNIYMREDGSVVDKIVLTTNPDYTPTDMGPAESMRASRTLATNARPADTATDVPRDVVLGWDAGEFAASHDVYLGTTYADVNDASRANPMDLLPSQGQAAATYDAGRLEFGQTYYWRIDEVNAAPDSTIYKGAVWSFTVEPLAYEIAGVIATSNATSAPDEGPENTVNGSGLNDQDEHSVESFDMWLGTPAGAEPVYLQYEFDRVYQLHELQVWNYNVIFELVLGFGVKDVTVEYSENGTDWMVLGDVEFAQGTAMPGYTANTTVDLGGVAAQYVRLTINSIWGPLDQYGLSEVRFLHVPAFAREPQPVDGATDVDVAAALIWRAGRKADVHEVYLGTDPNDLALIESAGGPSTTPADLEFGMSYFWKVDEVNEAEAVSAWESDVWSFQTLEFATIEDFESYDDDDEDNRIYNAWLDGWVNQTGSTVGYFEAPFAETSIVNSGRQSMPLLYDNSAGALYSEAEYDLGGMDLDTNGADTLRLFVAGQTPAFVETADGDILMNAIGADIWNNADEMRYVYQELTGDGRIIARVDRLDGTPSTWAKAGVMVRESTEPGAINTFMAMTGGDGGGATFQQRVATDDASVSQHTYEGNPFAPPYWVRLERAGNDFSAYISPDGETWQQAGDTVSVPMADPVLIGLALTSHNAAVSTGAEFSNISTTGNVTGSWQVAEIGVAQPTTGNDAEPVYVALEDSAGNVAVVTNPNAAVRSGWTEWLIPYSDLAGINLNSVSMMYIGLGDRDNPTAGGTGTIFVDDIGYGSPLAE